MAKRKRGANKTGTNGSQPTQKRAKVDQSLQNGAETAALDLEKSPFTETLTGEDRKREAKVYELLGSADSDERIAAADAIVTGLLISSEAALERHLDNRLFRGLASSRNASRVGFSLVIAEILNQLFGTKDLAKSKYPGLTFDKILNILVEKTTSSGHVPGQEERDFYFGRLFGLQCFVESKILFDEESRWPKVLELLLQMADKKVWIRSHSAWVIVESLPQMGQDRAEETLQQLSDIGLGKTAEGIGIWMRARSCYPNLKTPAKPWHDPMSPGVLLEVARVLKDNVAQDNGEDTAVTKSKQGGWTAQLHFVWDLILATFIGQHAGGKENKDQLKLFWTTVIDDGLFSKNASDAQKFRGFVIFQKFLQGFATDNPKLARELFTRNLMKCLMNQAAKEDRYLHRAALKSLQSIEKAVQASPELLLPVLKEVIGKHGAYDFDQRTNTKTVENLLQWVVPDDAKNVLHLLRDPIVIAKDNEVEKLRQVYAGYVSKLATQAKPVSETSSNSDGTTNVAELGVKELAACAYSIQPRYKPELSDKSREAFRRLLASTIGKVMKRRDDAEYLCNAVISVEPTAVSMSEEIKAEQESALKAMRKLLKAGKKSDSKSAGASVGLALLYAITILQLYDGAPDAISILQDLERCSEKMKSKEGGSSELLVEILLSLVSRQSPMMRQISEQVFEAFTSQISPEALELLTEPLVAEENEKGYQALFENLEDEDVEMDDAEDSNSGEDAEDVEEDEISEIGSDVEFVTLNGAEAAADDEDEDADGDSDAEDEDKAQTEANAKELADLDDVLASVLRSHRLDKDKEAESSDNDSDMTDSEMIALDEKLVEVFKQRAKNSGKKKEKKDAKESVVMFKHRILDFVALYLKHEAANPLAFSLLLPLLETVRTTAAKPLANKAGAAIENFAKAFKKARGANGDVTFDAEKQFALLKEIHSQAARDASHAYGRAASAASLLVASGLVADRENVEGVNEVYAKTFARCQRGELKIQGFFFSDWVNWGMGHAANASAGAVGGGGQVQEAS
ncbi:DNA polymerase phi-domain-containing protein [Annulohypoxylon bovei var. microspora]|nr:DNA polymerase phi-domain-containing protein [Annulohypoxylon bovei var. microspora]